jgi:signal transduction histidine kinase
MALKLLDEAADALDEGVDLDTGLLAVARRMVPAVADFCAIDVLSPGRVVGAVDGLSPGRVFGRIAVPRVLPGTWARAVDTWFPARPEGQHPIANTLRRGHPELVHDAKRSRETAGPGEDGSPPAPSSYLVVPIASGGQALGVLSLVSWTPARRYGFDDLRLARGLARQLALAIDNRRLRAEVGELLSVVSHELRTPLAALLGWISLLRGHHLSPAQVNHGLEVLERNTRLQARLLDDLLELTRLCADSAALDRSPVDIVVVVRDATASLAPEAVARGVQVRVEGEVSGQRVAGDPIRLRQLVRSVLASAIADSRTGDALAVRVTRPAGSSVCLTVSPEGAPSRSAGGAIDRPRRDGGDRGRRIGLLLARRLVEIHGGRIEIGHEGSAMGPGIRIALPALESEDSPPSTIRRRADLPDDPEAALAGCRILVIEDETDTREFLRIALKERGAIVRAAGSGAEALAVLDREPVDLVLSDLTLPDGEGGEVLRAIRARGLTELPAVALSALGGPAERAGSSAAGFAEHLVKPVDPEFLARCLARVLRRG